MEDRKDRAKNDIGDGLGWIDDDDATRTLLGSYAMVGLIRDDVAGKTEVGWQSLKQVLSTEGERCHAHIASARRYIVR
jgi:hypothetical protein